MKLDQKNSSPLRLLVMVLIAPAMFLLLHCSLFLPTVKNEFPAPSQEITAKPEQPGLYRVVIFNDSDELRFGLDHSGTIAVVISGKGLANLKMGRYIQLFLKESHYELDLLHKDLIDSRSKHIIIVEPKDNFIRIEADTPGHKVFELQSAPEGFTGRFLAQWKG